MNAMDFIADLRLKGRKPAFVMLDLADKAMPAWSSERGAVYADIAAGDPLADMDFRPLVGLKVHLWDGTGNEARLRRVAKACAEAKPALLTVLTGKGLHRLWADGRSDWRAF